MSAREWPDDALKAMHQAMFEDTFDGANLPLLGAGADAFATALAASGYRILAPGEMDRETLEAAAKVAEHWLKDWAGDLDGTRGAYIDAKTSGRMGGRRIRPEMADALAKQFKERADAVDDCATPVATAIRALGGGEG